MSDVEPTSVVVVSRNRPSHLRSLLQSLCHQTHPNFEVIVVADALPPEFEGGVRYCAFDEANISAARNVGIRNSAGSIIAFCDDDSVPDPPWLENLVAPLSDHAIGSVSGFTRGRNGISRQWGAMRFDRSGNDYPFDMHEGASFQIFDASPTSPIKLIGTNMAFRSCALQQVGGFDEAFRFFLDETDVKLRLDLADWKCAVVSNAQVHHHFAASDRRQVNRTPTNLHEIGASKAYFCTKHAPKQIGTALKEFTSEQLKRLTTMVSEHKLRRADVTPLMDTLSQGFTDGFDRTEKLSESTETETCFLRFESRTGEHVVLCSGPRDSKWARNSAADLINKGSCVSVIQLHYSPRYFQVSFEDGYWLHEGGVFGKSERTQPLLQPFSLKSRFNVEIQRISELHSVDKVLFGPSLGESSLSS